MWICVGLPSTHVNPSGSCVRRIRNQDHPVRSYEKTDSFVFSPDVVDHAFRDFNGIRHVFSAGW